MTSRSDLTARELEWLEEFPRIAEIVGYGPGLTVEDFDVPGVVGDMVALMRDDAHRPLTHRALARKNRQRPPAHGGYPDA